MVASAHDIAAELRRRVPGLPAKKLHKLLYYCQGHHLASFDRPLFREDVAAWDMGPVVNSLWKAEKYGYEPPAESPLGEAELNTIGYVLHRYGNLSGTDLQVMSHGETPWRLADAQRQPGQSVRIQQSWMRDYFRTDGAPGQGDDDDDAMPFDAAEVAALLAGARERLRQPGRPDSIEDLRARMEPRAS